MTAEKNTLNHIEMNSMSCSGCSACKAVCPKNAISFRNDEEGFLVPIIDSVKCINCGLCLKTCPALHVENKNRNESEASAFAYQNCDNKVRGKSASGALFPSIAYYFIKDLHGYVCGCILDDHLQPIHIVSNTQDDIQKMQDSKYVQSDMKNCMKEVCDLLQNDNYVLFTGTSCQCNGLISLLKTMRIQDDRLLTLDFFCHGVPSPLIWKEFLQFYSRKKNRKIVGYRFRNKSFGWGKQSRGASYLNTCYYRGLFGRVVKDSISCEARMWRNIFFSNICIRKYCHSCPYCSVQKPSDITMGDYWGIEKFNPEFNDGKGCSLAIVRNKKALSFIQKLKAEDLIKINLDDAIQCQVNAFKQSRPHENREEFWEDYNNFSFDFVIHKYFRYSLIFRIKRYIGYLLFIIGIKDYNS